MTKMQLAAEYVRRHPHCPILPVAKVVGPHESLKYGYRIVHRAIKAGLIKATHLNNRYRLEIP